MTNLSLQNLTAIEIKKKLQNKEISAIEIFNHFKSIITEKDQKLNSLISTTFDIGHNKALSLDKILANGEDLPPLGGVPIVIKDNIAIKGFRMTCASKMLENYSPPYSATVVEKLDKAGALIMGKANLDEFAMGSTTETSAFGPTLNPHNTAYSPGGSSGGSACAVASMQVPLSLGSDTGGSVRQPASFCGVLGLRPTYGLVSRYGLTAYANSLDQIGPLARSTKDLALLLNVIRGRDQQDPTSLTFSTFDLLDKLDEKTTSLRIGLPKESFNAAPPAINNPILRQVENLKQMGMIVEELKIPLIDYALAAYYILAPAEASANLARFDGLRFGLGEDSNGWKEKMIKSRSLGFGAEAKRRILLGTHVLSSGYYDAYYLKALKVRRLIVEDFQKTFTNFDVLITPVVPAPPPKIGAFHNNPMQMYYQDFLAVPASIAGLPALSVPIGFDGEGLPLSLQIISNYGREDLLLKLALNLETIISTPKGGL